MGGKIRVRIDESIGVYDSKTETWKSWPNNRAYWLDPNNKPPHWRIRRQFESYEAGRKLLAEIDQVERTKGFAQ
jgi:hypothetical protein